MLLLLGSPFKDFGRAEAQVLYIGHSKEANFFMPTIFFDERRNFFESGTSPPPYVGFSVAFLTAVAFSLQPLRDDVLTKKEQK